MCSTCYKHLWLATSKVRTDSEPTLEDIMAKCEHNPPLMDDEQQLLDAALNDIAIMVARSFQEGKAFLLPDLYSKFRESLSRLAKGHPNTPPTSRWLLSHLVTLFKERLGVA